MKRRVVIPLLAVLGVLVVGLAIAGAVIGSKSGSNGSSSGAASYGYAESGSDSGAGSAAGPGAGPAPKAAASGAASNGADDLGQAGAVDERDIVRTAQISVTAGDPARAASSATSIAGAAGGRVDQDNRDSSAHLVLRVPAATLEATLGKLAALGEETSRQVQGDDVTGQTADLGARVQALQTSVDRLRSLLSTSGSLSDLLSVETQLTQRQADLESLQAQQKALADQVALATITLDLVAPATAAAAATGPTGFGGAVAGGWHGFTVAVRYLLAGLGYTLPFLLLAAVALGVVVVVRRRRAGRAVAQSQG